jgi:hypothetical protein
VIVLLAKPGLPASALTDIERVAGQFPGDEPLTILLSDNRSLELGPEWRYDASTACLEALSHFGVVLPRISDHRAPRAAPGRDTDRPHGGQHGEGQHPSSPR